MKPVYFNVDAKLPDGSDTNFILAVTIKKLGNKQIKIITDREGCLSDDSDDDSFDLENTTLTFIDNGTGFTFSRGEELKFVFYDADNNVVNFIVSKSFGVAVDDTNTVCYQLQPTDRFRGDFEDGNPEPNSLNSPSISIPEINVQMKSSAIVAKTKKLKAVWTPEFAQDLNAYHALDAEAELTSILSEYISLEIDLEILSMLITSAAAGTDGGRLRLKPTGILELKDMRTADGSSPTLVLQTGDTDIAQNDILGTINFQAPDEGTGTDAILVAAGIEAISEGDFSSSSNATSLRFKTGSSAAASERMRLTSAGRLGINTTSPDALLDVEGTTDAEIRVTRTTANFSASTNTDAGSVLNLENKVLFENGYGGDSNVGQILFNSQDDSTGQGLRAKIACHKIGFGHFESLSFHL